MLSGDALEYSTKARKDDENVNRIKEPKTILDVLADSDLKRMAELLETNYGKYYRYRNMWRRVLLWRETMWLRATYGLRDRAISRILNVPRGAVSDWVYNRCNPLGRHNIPVITPRLGYGVGAALGDGSANIKIRRLEFQALRDFNFAESIRDSLDGSWTRTDDNEGYYVYCSNKMLSELVALGKIDSQILLKILTIDEEVMKSAVRGFFDADGVASNEDDGSASVEAKNTNLEIIKLVTTLLGQLKIHYRTTCNKHPLELVSPNNGRHYRKKTPYIHRIYIRRCCLHRFSAMVGFKIERKSKDLQEIIERIKFRHICPTV